jgi:hypothetical protein
MCTGPMRNHKHAPELARPLRAPPAQGLDNSAGCVYSSVHLGSWMRGAGLVLNIGVGFGVGLPWVGPLECIVGVTTGEGIRVGIV